MDVKFVIIINGHVYHFSDCDQFNGDTSQTHSNLVVLDKKLIIDIDIDPNYVLQCKNNRIDKRKAL